MPYSVANPVRAPAFVGMACRITSSSSMAAGVTAVPINSYQGEEQWKSHIHYNERLRRLTSRRSSLLLPRRSAPIAITQGG